MKENKTSSVIIVILIIILGWTIFHKDEYEGFNAEEWFNEYDYMDAKYRSFRSCVEDFDSFNIETQIDYGGIFYYCE